MSRPRRTAFAVALVALAVAAAALAAGQGSPAVKRPPGVIIGVNANSQGYVGSTGRIQSLVAKGRIAWLREDLRWDLVEPVRGSYDWSTYDALYADAARRRMHILPILLSTPRWAGATVTTLPPDPTAFAAFAAAAAERYGPGGRFWREHPQLPQLPSRWFEVWNEPTERGAVSNGINPGRYAGLYRATVQRARALKLRARFLLYTELEARLPDNRFVSWVDAMFDAVPDLGQYVDGVSAHPYSVDLRRNTPDRDHLRQFSRILSIQQRLAGRGVAGRPFWVTEVGWATCRTGAYCYSEKRQRDLVRELMSVVQTTYRGKVQALFFYSFADQGRTSPDREDHFGLVRDSTRGFAPKPAWKELTAILAR